LRIEKKFSAIDDYIDGKEVIIAEDKLKNASSRRTLPLIPHIEKLLLEEKQKQEYYMDLLKDGYNMEYKDYICRDNFGNLITPAFVSDHFRFMIRKHGMRKIRFHDLRHSCASLLLANGIQMKQIQDCWDTPLTTSQLIFTAILITAQSWSRQPLCHRYLDNFLDFFR